MDFYSSMSLLYCRIGWYPVIPPLQNNAVVKIVSLILCSCLLLYLQKNGLHRKRVWSVIWSICYLKYDLLFYECLSIVSITNFEWFVLWHYCYYSHFKTRYQYSCSVSCYTSSLFITVSNSSFDLFVIGYLYRSRRRSFPTSYLSRIQSLMLLDVLYTLVGWCLSPTPWPCG